MKLNGLQNLRIRVDYPLNSPMRVIVHQKCVESIRYYNSLKSVTLQNNETKIEEKLQIFRT